jgi:hypothetical protein
MKSSVDRLNWVNVCLMAVSCCAAIAAPFHLFLLAYAVLGPLHYLTEISWLHDREYFAPRKPFRRAWLALVSAAMLAVTIGYVASEFLGRPVSPNVEIGLVVLAFAGAALAIFVTYRGNALALLVVVAAAVAILVHDPRFAIAAYLLVTMVHVLVFTGCFILFGASKSGSSTGYLSFGVFCVCVVATLALRGTAFQPGQSVQTTYSAFGQLNAVLLMLMGQKGLFVYSVAARHVMQLIAFAYTYHYLNWFSKTSIIKWHEVSRRRSVSIVALWLLSVGVYAYDFRIGFAVSYVLSVLHVLLEFPLNHQSIVGLLRAVRLPAHRLVPRLTKESGLR